MAVEKLYEKLTELEAKMNQISDELMSVINNPKKLKAIKRLSLKLYEASDLVIKTKEEINSLEVLAVTKVITDGDYVISIIEEKYAKIEKIDGTLVLNYIYLDNVVGNNVYSSFRRSNGIIDGTEIYEREFAWTQKKNNIAKDSRARIAIAESVMNKHISFVGGAQIV